MNDKKTSSAGSTIGRQRREVAPRLSDQGRGRAAMLPLAARMVACDSNSNTSPPLNHQPGHDRGQPARYDHRGDDGLYSSTDVQILATGFQVEKQASNTYTPRPRGWASW